ncbi:unnamed protein product [Cuscuta epithymum]|uniref:Pentatricopeptide repeat-containing protein n=1 Tax=Cuscuta epithymum TaxID=186058 RepID=A0AAV0FSA3_9ASTE|nr:unnamed protein product [Cuscuta epithymum]
MAVTDLLRCNRILHFPSAPSRTTRYLPYSSSMTELDIDGAGVDSDSDGGDCDRSSPSTSLTPTEIDAAEKLHIIIKEHYRKNPDVPSSINPNFTLSALSSGFSEMCADKTISAAVIRRVIEKCGEARRGVPFHQALAFFNWAKARYSFQTPEPYSELVDLAGKAREFSVAWHMIRSMKSSNIRVPRETFLNLIRRYVRAGLTSEAEHTFDMMEEYDCKPDRNFFTAVICILSKKRRATEAQKFFNRLKDKYEADVVVYSSLVHGWCRAGNISEAQRVFNEMKVAGVEPNVYTYTIVIDALCRGGQITRAQDVFSEMIEKGCPPNTVTFNNLMRVHVKAGRTEKVLQVYNQMKRLSCLPDIITFNFLIESHCKDGNRDDAIMALNVMVKRGCGPNAFSFNPIFRCIAKSQDVNAAHRLSAQMKDLGCKPNTETYNILMKMFVEMRSTDMVIKLKKEMEEKQVEPSVNTFRVLIRMFCGMGHWNHAYQCFTEMVEKRCIRPGKADYELVVQLLKKAGQMKKHEELVSKMVQRGYLAAPPFLL